MSQERILKKYPNRRLYDTEASCYITLAQVKDLVMRDIGFKVVDSQTEQDITRGILLQIIMEQEAGGHPIFTADMLSRFIRFYGDAAQSTLSSFLEQGLDFMLKQQRLINEQTKSAWPVNPMEFWTKLGHQNMDFWSQMDAFYRDNAKQKPDSKPE
jgi:polyhydroxyalkanoate synthesis repressor PhaR